MDAFSKINRTVILLEVAQGLFSIDSGNTFSKLFEREWLNIILFVTKKSKRFDFFVNCYWLSIKLLINN